MIVETIKAANGLDENPAIDCAAGWPRMMDGFVVIRTFFPYCPSQRLQFQSSADMDRFQSSTV